MLSNLRTDLLDDLRRGSGVLEGISVECVQRLRGLRVVSFYEREYTGLRLFTALVGYLLPSFLHDLYYSPYYYCYCYFCYSPTQ